MQRENIEMKVLPLEALAFKGSDDGSADCGAFSGYGSVFGHIDLQGDVVERGAFARSLRERGGIVPLLFMHDPKELIGQLVCEEDAKGLKVSGTIALGVEKGREVYALLKKGFLRGMSIGYRTVKEKAERGARRLLDLDLWEVSLVTFPANPAALVSSVKSAAAAAPSALGVDDWDAWIEETLAEGEAEEREAQREAIKSGWGWLDAAEQELKLEAKAREFLAFCFRDLKLTGYFARIEWMDPVAGEDFHGAVRGLSLDVIQLRRGLSEAQVLLTCGHEAAHLEQMLRRRLPRLAAHASSAVLQTAEREAESFARSALARWRGPEYAAAAVAEYERLSAAA